MNYIIKKSSSAVYKEKRSEFIGFSKPIKDIQAINTNLKKLKSKYSSATHICWAYRVYANKGVIENSSDAGEPSGSAGLPMLNVMKQHNIINCGVFIVRYFGGMKLGKPRLINAYKTTTELVITSSTLVKWLPKEQYIIKSSIKYFGKITNIVRQNDGKIISDHTTDKLSLLIELPIEKYNNFVMEFDKITQNFGIIKKRSEHDQTKEVRK